MRGPFIPRYRDKNRNILVNIDDRKVTIIDLRDNTYHETRLYKNHLQDYFVFTKSNGKQERYNRFDLIQLSLEEVFKYVNK